MKPDVVWHSGKLRARQTAEIFWKACNPFAPITAERGLLPEDPPQWIRDRLAGETRSVLLAMLTGTGDAMSFPLHGCVALEVDGEIWKEVWRLGS